jgi:molybdenum cofactor guanylyltransferase
LWQTGFPVADWFVSMIPPITAGILTGGRGSRMGGMDKGLANLGGRPLIEHLLERLEPQATRLIINANRNHDHYRQYGHPVVPDRMTGFQGPLAGIAALLEACEDSWLVTIPCDAPFVPPDYIPRLWKTAAQTHADIVVADDGNGIQPVHALIARTLLDDLGDFLAGGHRKPRQWFQRHRWTTADFSDQPEAFINLNRPEDYRELPAWS